MIKCDGTSVELRGKGIDILTDLGVLTEQIIVAMQKEMPREVAIGAVEATVNLAIKLSGEKCSEEQKRMQEVAEILKNMQKTEE